MKLYSAADTRVARGPTETDEHTGSRQQLCTVYTERNKSLKLYLAADTTDATELTDIDPQVRSKPQQRAINPVWNERLQFCSTERTGMTPSCD